jgi:hypothetical protein
MTRQCRFLKSTARTVPASSRAKAGESARRNQETIIQPAVKGIDRGIHVNPACKLAGSNSCSHYLRGHFTPGQTLKRFLNSFRYGPYPNTRGQNMENTLYVIPIVNSVKVAWPGGAWLAFYIGLNIEHFQIDKPSTSTWSGTSHLKPVFSADGAILVAISISGNIDQIDHSNYLTLSNYLKETAAACQINLTVARIHN